jgi:transcriptional regulator with PAS, ATPase and Fis domain
VRLIAATNRDLHAATSAKHFREDLYYRINVMTLALPPLRQRREDIPLLVEYFTGPDWQLPSETMKILTRYHWPGNIRQLMNAIERAKILADDHVIRLENMPPEVMRFDETEPQILLEPDADLATVKRTHVVETLKRERGNKMRTAKALGISRRSLYRLLEKYKIELT